MTDILELLAEPGAAVTRADVIREIERLREEKADLLAVQEGCGDMWLWSEDLRKRVREALGE